MIARRSSRRIRLPQGEARMLLAVILFASGCSDPPRQGAAVVSTPTEVGKTSGPASGTDAAIKDLSPIKPH